MLKTVATNLHRTLTAPMDLMTGLEVRTKNQLDRRTEGIEGSPRVSHPARWQVWVSPPSRTVKTPLELFAFSGSHQPRTGITRLVQPETEISRLVTSPESKFPGCLTLLTDIGGAHSIDT